MRKEGKGLGKPRGALFSVRAKRRFYYQPFICVMKLMKLIAIGIEPSM